MATEFAAAEPRRSRGRPRQGDAIALEEQLLAVAFKEFVRHGYGGASLNRIIATAGVSKTTLYARFASKEALFRAIICQQINRLTDLPKLAAALSGSAVEEGLVAYADYVLELSLKGEVLAMNRLIYSEAHRFPELGAASAERFRMGVEHIASFIEKCAAAEGVACKDPTSAAEAFILMLRGWYMNLALTNQKGSRAERKHWVRRAVHTLIADWHKW